MAASPLAKKLGIKAGHKVLVLNSPEGYIDSLSDLPQGVELSTDADGAFDFIQVFVNSKAEVDNLAPTGLGALQPGGLLWFPYPKKTSKIATDISRDTGWDRLAKAKMRPVSQISIDETWSALRFRPVDDVKPIR